MLPQGLCQHLDSDPSEAHLGLSASSTVKEYISVILFVAICYRRPRDLAHLDLHSEMAGISFAGDRSPLDSWTIKKAEYRTDALELWCWRRLLKTPLDCKEIKPVNPKGNQP